jgi:hypothetical protein
MSWGSNNQSTQAPNYKVLENANAASAVGTGNLFNNVTVGAFVTNHHHENMAVGVFGANSAEVASNDKIPHTGWHLVRQGAGPVKGLTISAGGSGYGNLAVGLINGGSSQGRFTISTNSTGGITSTTIINGGGGFNSSNPPSVAALANSILTFTIGGGSGYANGEAIDIKLASSSAINATGSIVTNATGGITSIVLSSAGAGFPNTTAPTVTITTANGTNGNVSVNSLSTGSSANLTFTLGGRAGRVHYETLVTLKKMTSGSSGTLP